MGREDYYGTYLGMDERTCTAALLQARAEPAMPSSTQRFSKGRRPFELIVSADECSVWKPDPTIYEFTLRQLNARRAGMLAGLKTGHAHLGCRHDLSGIRVEQCTPRASELGRNPPSGSCPTAILGNRRKTEARKECECPFETRSASCPFPTTRPRGFAEGTSTKNPSPGRALSQTHRQIQPRQTESTSAG